MLNGELSGRVFSGCIFISVLSYMKGIQQYILSVALKTSALSDHEWMTERRATLGKLKLFENILKAASALIASAMSIIKFIGIIGKIKPAAL